MKKTQKKKAVAKKAVKKPAARKVPPQAFATKGTPRALICGMLEQGEKMLFLVRKDERGVERVEMPCAFGTISAGFTRQLAEAFGKQTNVKAIPGNLRMEGRHNVGSASKPEWVPVLVFEMTPQDWLVRPSPGSGIARCEWLTLMDAKSRQLTDNGMWLLEDTEIVEP
jgi:hypothetical protein